MRAEEAVSPIDQVKSDPAPEPLFKKRSHPPMTCVLLAQTLDDVDARLTSVSDQMNLCTAILSDLKELGDVLVVGRVFFLFSLSLAPHELF